MRVCALVLLLAASGCGRHAAPTRTPAKPRPAVRLLWTSPAVPGRAPSYGSLIDGSDEVAVLVPVEKEPERGRLPRYALYRVSSRQVARVGGVVQGADIAWDPTGRRLAFWQFEGRALLPKQTTRLLRTRVQIADISALRVQPLKLPEASYLALVWSPDGEMLACETSEDATGALVTSITVAHTRSGIVRSYPLGASAVVSGVPPAWSADGRRLIFVALVQNGRTLRRELSNLDLASGRIDHLYAEPVSAGSYHMKGLAIDPDGGVPCYVSGEARQGQQEKAMLLRVEPGTQGPRVAGSFAAPRGWELQPPRIAPDGRGMVAAAIPWERHGLDPLPCIILWSLDGATGHVDLPPRPPGATVLAWSRDSRHFAISYREGEASRIAVYEVRPRR